MANSGTEALLRATTFTDLKETSLRELAGVLSPLRDSDKAHRQLAFVEKHVRHPKLDARSVALEDHYIDRDFMEDHSIFYSKNLVPVSNHCKRLHFFNIEAAVVEQRLRQIRQFQTPKEFRSASEGFASDHYLGFCVIRPLSGSPVGRTVLRPFPKQEETFSRDFSCACDYNIHLLGVPLRIRGLAFQQQDLGVSACATTALWSALHRARELDGGFPATPAQITLRASQFALPFGRSMPSEGLSLDQMCQAVQALGYAPNLFRADKYVVSRWILYSAVRSGISPVLILSTGSNIAHAVTVAGMKLSRKHQVEDQYKDETASDLIALYLHDDRYGPYMRADLQKRNDDLILALEITDSKYGTKEAWRLSHILVPMHNKVRLSFPQLRTTALWINANFQARREELGLGAVATGISSWIEKSTRYVESQIVGEARLPAELLGTLCGSLKLSRYIGIVRLDTSDIGMIDILLDTTSTQQNLQCLAVLRRGEPRTVTSEIAGFVAKRLGVPYLG